MFQYRTHLELPANATADLGNGTKTLVSSLSADDRNSFTMKKYKLTDFEGNEG